jgi:DNA polymerase-3 subunit gamma/tau
VAARAWQVLLRGLDEVKTAADGAMAAEMLLLRLACLAELPPPGELLRKLERLSQAAPPASAARPEPTPASPTPSLVQRAPAMPAAPAPSRSVPQPGAGEPADFPALVAFLRSHGEPLLASMLETGVHLVRMAPQRLEIRPAAGVRPDLANLLQDALHQRSGKRWIVAIVNERGMPTLAEQHAALRERLIAELSADPAIRRILDAYPGARIEDVRPAATEFTSPYDQPEKRIERA